LSLSDFFLPELAAFLGLIYLIGRCMYGKGYYEDGPEGRINGAKLSILSTLALWLVTIYLTWT